MGEKNYAKIIGKNLKRVMYDAGKTQSEVSNDLKISKATISSWMNGTRIPRMDKIDLLCHYFNVTRAEIMEEHVDNSTVQLLASNALRPDESQLLNNYNLLNETGKEKAQDSVHDLTEIKRYRKDNKVTSFPVLNAAHERTDIDVTSEMLQHDDDIMDNDDEW